MSMFKDGAEVGYPQAEHVWPDRVQVTVDKRGVSAVRAGVGLGPHVTLVATEYELSPARAEDIIRHVVNVGGTSPVGTERDPFGVIGVPLMEPDEVDAEKVVWCAGRWIRVVWHHDNRAFVGIDPDEGGDTTTIGLGYAESWQLVRALASLREWWSRVEEQRGEVGRDLLAGLIVDHAADISSTGPWAPVATARQLARAGQRLVALAGEWAECTAAPGDGADPERTATLTRLAAERWHLTGVLGRAHVELLAQGQVADGQLDEITGLRPRSD